MDSWLDIEARFRELASPMRHIRLTSQTGADGEHWRLAGVYDRVLFEQFENLCRLAGEQLTAVCANDSSYAEILDHSDPLIRWYRALGMQPRAVTNPMSMYSENPDGTRNWSHVGDIEHVPQMAANLCLRLHGTHPISSEIAEASWVAQIWDKYAMPILIAVVSGLILALLTQLI